MINSLVGIIAIIFGIWAGYFFFVDIKTYPQASSASSQTPIVPPLAENSGFIRVTTPIPNAFVQNPILIQGEARGTWFFEGSFPIYLLDENGKEIARMPAQALSEWMTENFVPFQAILYFQRPASKNGTLVLEKDNPSGLPQHTASIRIPIRFQ